MTPAPVVLLGYNRPEHTHRCLQSLARSDLASQTALHVFIDGPRVPQGAALQAAVAAAVESFRGRFAAVTVVCRERNLGLAGNVVDGVTRLIGGAGRAIVVEDDLELAPGYLPYMNLALDRYAGDPRVGSIHGYCYPGMPDNPPFFFMPGGDCWGWATWSDRWQLYRPDGRVLLSELLRSSRLLEFTLGFSAPYLRMLCQQILGRNNSWAVRWHASLFLRGLLTLYPATSLVQNTGLDGSGTHCDETREFDSGLNLASIESSAGFPAPQASSEAYRHFQHFFCGGRSGLQGAAFRAASAGTDLYWLARVAVGH